jgi:hypothetical protein
MLGPVRSTPTRGSADGGGQITLGAQANHGIDDYV